MAEPKHPSLGPQQWDIASRDNLALLLTSKEELRTLADIEALLAGCYFHQWAEASASAAPL